MEDFWVFHNRLKFTWFSLGDNTSSFPVPYSYRIDIGFPKSVGPRDGDCGQHSGVNLGANTSLGQTLALTLEIPSWMGTQPRTQCHSYPSIFMLTGPGSEDAHEYQITEKGSSL